MVTSFLSMSSQVLAGAGVPGDAGRDLVGDAAEPGELGAVELGAGRRQQRRRRDGAAERADGGAVLRRHRIDELRGAQAAGAGHVLRHDIGVSGDVLAEMARQQPAVEIVAAADAVADDQIDGLALVEILDAVGACALDRESESASKPPAAAQRRGSESTLSCSSCRIFQLAVMTAGQYAARHFAIACAAFSRTGFGVA